MAFGISTRRLARAANLDMALRMAAVGKTNKQTETIYDSFGKRFKHPLHVATPPKHLLHRFGRLLVDAARNRVEREIESDDCLGGILQYGFPVGDVDFRDELAAFLSKEYGSLVKSENLVQTAGATVSLVYMLDQLFPRKTTVYMENISFSRTMVILREYNYKTRAIRTQLDGIDVEDLERVWSQELKNSSSNSSNDEYSAVLYLVPQYQNPTGTVISDRKAKRVVELARKYNVLVLCDDVYNLHHHDDVLHKRLFAYDQEAAYGKDHVVSSGSFSKIFMPALRLGWVEAGPTVRRRCFEQSPITCSAGSLNTFMAGLVTEILRTGQGHEHVALNREDSKRKMAVALETLTANLPAACKIVNRPTGGYFVYVQLPMALNSTLACERLRDEHDIFVFDGRLFWTGDQREEDPDFPICNGIRISIPYPTEEHLRLAMLDLCAALTKMCREVAVDNPAEVRGAFPRGVIG